MGGGTETDGFRPVSLMESRRVRRVLGWGWDSCEGDCVVAPLERRRVPAQTHLTLPAHCAVLRARSRVLRLRVPPLFPVACARLLPSGSRGAAPPAPLSAGKGCDSRP